MLHAVAEALHLSGASVNTNEGKVVNNNTLHWSALTERDAQRFVAVGLQLEPSAPTPAAISAQTQRVQGQFCFQYIRPWECEPPVQVLRLREEVQARPRSQDLSATGTPAVAAAVVHPRAEDSKRRRSLMVALRSPLRSHSDNASMERENGSAEHQIAVVSEQSDVSTTASPRCKIEVMTPSRSAMAAQAVSQGVVTLQHESQPPPQQQQQQQQQALRTPEPVVTGKRKRVSVTISPPALPQAPRAPQAAALPSVRSSSRWVSPKPERLLRQQQQMLQEQQQQEQPVEPEQPPLKTRRLCESGAKDSMASRVASTLRMFFNEMCGNGSDETASGDNTSGLEAPSDDASDSEGSTESDASDASEASSTSSNCSTTSDNTSNHVGDADGGEFGDCDQYGGNATLLADIQDALEPVWSLLETTSSRFQRLVVWGGGVRDLPSSSARVPQLTQKNTGTSGSIQPPIGTATGIVATTELTFDGEEFGDEDGEDGWTNAMEKSDKLAVRTRRQCREMRQLSTTAWRLW